MGLKIKLARPTAQVTTFGKVAARTLFRNEVDKTDWVYLKLDFDAGPYNAIRLNDALPVGVDSSRSIVVLEGHLNVEDL